MSTLDANRLRIILYPVAAFLLYKITIIRPAVESQPHRNDQRFNREKGVVAPKVMSVAAYPVLVLQVLLLLLLLLLQARVSSPPQGSDLHSYDALFTVEPCFGRCFGAETALLAWWVWRYAKTTGCHVGLCQLLRWCYIPGTN